AESLAAIDPSNLDGIMLAGDAHVGDGDFLGAIPFYRRVADADSLSMHTHEGRCRGCDAEVAITLAELWAGSLPAADREARTGSRRDPDSWLPMGQLLEILRREGRLVAVDSILDHYQSSGGDPSSVAWHRALVDLTRGDLDQADTLCVALI